MTQLLEQASETEVRGESGVAGTENVTAGTPPRRRRRAKLRSLQSWDGSRIRDRESRRKSRRIRSVSERRLEPKEAAWGSRAPVAMSGPT